MSGWERDHGREWFSISGSVYFLVFLTRGPTFSFCPGPCKLGCCVSVFKLYLVFAIFLCLEHCILSSFHICLMLIPIYFFRCWLKSHSFCDSFSPLWIKSCQVLQYKSLLPQSNYLYSSVYSLSYIPSKLLTAETVFLCIIISPGSCTVPGITCLIYSCLIMMKETKKAFRCDVWVDFWKQTWRW